MMAEYVTIAVFGTFFFLLTGEIWDLADDVIFYTVYAVSKVLIWGIILCIKRMIGKKAVDVLTGREWWALFAVSFITLSSCGTIVAEIDLLHHTNQPLSFFYIIVGLLAVNLIVYSLINHIIEREMKLREHAVFREKVKSETAMYHSISENLEKQ